MRRLPSVGVLLVILVATAPVSAQIPTGLGSFNGATPRQINFQRIDMTPMTANMSLANTFRTPSKQQAFSLANVFHGFTLPSWPPVFGTPSVLPTSQNFLQPTQQPGLNIFPTTAAYPTTNNPYIIHKAWN